MARHSIATAHEEKSHLIDASLTRRARLLITKGSIPTQPIANSNALETKHPYLVQRGSLFLFRLLDAVAHRLCLKSQELYLDLCQYHLR